MSQEVLTLEIDILRDEEFIETQFKTAMEDLDEPRSFRSIGDVLNQLAFKF